MATEARPTPRTYQSFVNAMTTVMSQRNRLSVKSWAIQVFGETDNPMAHLANMLRRAAPRRTVRVLPFQDNASVAYIQIGRLDLFADLSDSRWWLLHSAEEAASIEPVIRRWIADDSNVDFIALPEHLLLKAANTGTFVGFGLHHSLEFLSTDPDVADTLSVRLSGRQSREALQDLRVKSSFSTSALTSIRVRQPFSGPGAMTAGRITSSVTNAGRVSSRGDSFDRHSLMVAAVVGDYQALVRDVEERGTMGALDPDGLGLRGPVELDLGRPIDDLEGFCARAFSGFEPFYIWGFLEKRSPDLIVANCLDRRSERALTIEAYADRWLVYLPDGTPGSVLMRLWSRMQVHHDRHATVVGFEGSDVVVEPET
jgi:hypothetical protein